MQSQSCDTEQAIAFLQYGQHAGSIWNSNLALDDNIVWKAYLRCSRCCHRSVSDARRNLEQKYSSHWSKVSLLVELPLTNCSMPLAPPWPAMTLRRNEHDEHDLRCLIFIDESTIPNG